MNVALAIICVLGVSACLFNVASAETALGRALWMGAALACGLGAGQS